jgi:hypothetical protein
LRAEKMQGKHALMNAEKPSKPKLSGQAAIALASAAGVIVATRMSRTGLLLTAGLAWYLWKQQAEQPQGHLPPADEQPTREPPDFPQAPCRPENQDEKAWSELRKAIQPFTGEGT